MLLKLVCQYGYTEKFIYTRGPPGFSFKKKFDTWHAKNTHLLDNFPIVCIMTNDHLLCCVSLKNVYNTLYKAGLGAHEACLPLCVEKLWEKFLPLYQIITIHVIIVSKHL